MIAVNPRNHGVKSAIFRMPFRVFTTLVSVTFFRVQLDEVQLWNLWGEVGLNKVPLVF